MLKMSGLSKVYRTEMVETYALRDFNLQVKQGEFVAVTGPSGSGKTTFLTIAGLLEAHTGAAATSSMVSRSAASTMMPARASATRRSASSSRPSI